MEKIQFGYTCNQIHLNCLDIIIIIIVYSQGAKYRVYRSKCVDKGVSTHKRSKLVYTVYNATSKSTV